MLGTVSFVDCVHVDCQNGLESVSIHFAAPSSDSVVCFPSSTRHSNCVPLPAIEPVPRTSCHDSAVSNHRRTTGHFVHTSIAKSGPLVENIRSRGIGVNLPRKRTHRGGRREQRRIVVLSRLTADPVAVPSPDFDLWSTDRRAGPDLNNLISISLSPRPKSAPADTLRVALFSARSVTGPLRRAEISTVIYDYQVDILFFTESWLR